MVLDSGHEILDSWKQIAQYLHREVRTCYRWSRELGLPVYRIDEKSPKSKVFAYKDEIDKWLKEKTKSQVLPKNGFHTKRRLIYGSISFFAMLSLVAIATWQPFTSSRRMISVAAVPLQSLDPSGNDVYLSEELSRAIVENLSVPNKLRVIPAFSIRKFANGFTDAVRLGDELDADYVLWGEVDKGNPTTHVSIKLIRTDHGATVWKSEFLEPFERAMTIPPNICAAIHKVLKIGNGTFARNGFYPEDYRAMDSYLKGDFILSRLNSGSDDPWQFYHQGEYYAGRFTPEANELAIKLFSQAIEIDPEFAPAYIGLATCYANYVNFNWQFDVSWLNKAEHLLRTALSLNPDLPDYFSVLIEVRILKETGFSEDVWASIEELVEEGVKRYINHPRLNSIVGYYYYKKYGRYGDEMDFRKALEYKERSFWLDPYDLGNIVYANLLMLNKEFKKALEVCEVVGKLDDTCMSRFLRGEIYYYMSALNASRSEFKELLNESFEYRIASLYHLAMISAREGDAGGARELVQEIERISPDSFAYFENELKLASVQAGMGETALASKILGSFIRNPKYRNDLHIYRRYVDIDENFLKLRDDKSLERLFSQKGEDNGKK